MFTEECRRQNIDAPNPGVLHLLEEMGPMSQQQLGRKLRIDRTTMVKIVDSLEEKHLARRRNHPEDRRAYLVEISAQGKKALAAAARVAEKLESELLARFSPEERKLIRRALLTLAG